jgi:hypothetical protein
VNTRPRRRDRMPRNRHGISWEESPFSSPVTVVRRTGDHTAIGRAHLPCTQDGHSPVCDGLTSAPCPPRRPCRKPAAEILINSPLHFPRCYAFRQVSQWIQRADTSRVTLRPLLHCDRERLRRSVCRGDPGLRGIQRPLDQPQRIDVVEGTANCVLVQVGLGPSDTIDVTVSVDARPQAQRVLPDKPAPRRIVVPRPVVRSRDSRHRGRKLTTVGPQPTPAWRPDRHGHL